MRPFIKGMQPTLIARGDGLDEHHPVLLGDASLRLVRVEQVAQGFGRGFTPSPAPNWSWCRSHGPRFWGRRSRLASHGCPKSCPGLTPAVLSPRKALEIPPIADRCRPLSPQPSPLTGSVRNPMPYNNGHENGTRSCRDRRRLGRTRGPYQIRLALWNLHRSRSKRRLPSLPTCGADVEQVPCQL